RADEALAGAPCEPDGVQGDVAHVVQEADDQHDARPAMDEPCRAEAADGFNHPGRPRSIGKLDGEAGDHQGGETGEENPVLHTLVRREPLESRATARVGDAPASEEAVAMMLGIVAT